VLQKFQTSYWQIINLEAQLNSLVTYEKVKIGRLPEGNKRQNNILKSTTLDKYTVFDEANSSTGTNSICQT